MVPRHLPSIVRSPAVRRNEAPISRLTGTEREVATFLSTHPSASTLDIVFHLSSDFFERSQSDRVMLWNTVSTTLTRMLAKNVVRLDTADVELVQWSVN